MAKMNPTIRKILFFSAVCLAICLIKFREDRDQYGNINGDSDTLRCVFALGRSIYDLNGFPEELNYEMLSKYATQESKILSLDKVKVDEVWAPLIAGEYDIAVFDLANEIPEEISDDVAYSTQTKDEIAWVVKRENHSMLVSINNWLRFYTQSKEYFKLISKYYRSYRVEPYLEQNKMMKALSPYDDIVKNYSEANSLDWRLVTSVMYYESRFHILAQSHKDAIGLMQLKRVTAERFGANDSMVDPQQNIMIGTQYLHYLMNMFDNENINELNKLKFVLAAYNAGEGRIAHVRNVADSLGFNQFDWDDTKNAFEAIPRFSGKETSAYVENVLERYNQYVLLTTNMVSEKNEIEEDDTKQDN